MHLDPEFIKRLLVGNIEYILLVISMMMTQMIWLRSLAIASGVAGFVYSLWWLHDPVGVFWETVFTLVNIVQLTPKGLAEQSQVVLDLEEHARTTTPEVYGSAKRSARRS